MKKRFSVIIALVLILAIAVPVLASCVNEKDVKEIQIVGAKTAYKVGDEIDYDGLQVKVVYDDDTSETKTVKALGASVTRADLSKAGNSSYTVSYKGKTVTVNITVEATQQEITNFQARTFVEPTFYTAYKSQSATSADPETRADFRIKGETYEVGNANKFIFRPTATGLNIEQHKTETLTNVKTTAKVFSKDSKSATYAELTGEDLTDFVTIDNNTYKFADESAGKYVKLEISIDAEEYDVEAIEEENRTITVEFVVVDGGYNVYDQLGLSVMADLEKQAWADLWGATATWNEGSATYVLSAKQGETPVQLEADDQPLYAYVGNVKAVVLHTAYMGVDANGDPAVKNLELDADQMPASYFWNGTEPEYNTAYASLNGLPDMQAKLKGSLRDGENGNNYYRVIDLVPGTATSADTLIPLNMQKGLFATSRVSVSGNYNSITVPETASKGGRNLITVVDYGNESDSKASDPVPHWSVFQIYMREDQSGHDAYYSIKNLALSGNAPKVDLNTQPSFQADESAAKGTPSGMMMVNCYSRHLTFNNIVADKFFTNILVDGYGDTGVDILNTKIYDSYSNMCYMWRSKINIENSELIGAGGPLFILCDGDTHFVQDNHTDAEGSNMTVDKSTVLQSYATGNESWYAIYNAQPLVQQFTGPLNQTFAAMGKTIVTEQNGQSYVNVIAVIICSPSSLMSGNSQNMLDVCGTYTTVDGETTVERFEMHNQMLVALRANAQNNALAFPLIMQTGNLFMFTDGTSLFTLGAQGAQPFNPATDGVAWATDTHDKLAVYMSAASQSQSAQAPYFGVILDIKPLQQGA